MWWNFLQCQDYAGIGKIGDEALAKQCLNVVGGPRWEEDGIKKCVQGSLGKKLLQESVKESKKEKIG